MTDPGMVERVARALEPGAFETFDKGYTQRNGFDTRAFLNAEKTVRRARRKARTALLAMRDPSEGMVEAGRSLPNPEYGRILTLPKHLRLIWQAMIDAALGGGGE